MALWLVAEHAGSEPMILTPGVAVTVGKRDVDRRDGKLSKVLFRLVMKSEEEAAVTRVGRTPVYVQPKGETGKLTMAQEGAGKSSNDEAATERVFLGDSIHVCGCVCVCVCVCWCVCGCVGVLHIGMPACTHACSSKYAPTRHAMVIIPDGTLAGLKKRCLPCSLRASRGSSGPKDRARERSSAHSSCGCSAARSSRRRTRSARHSWKPR